MFATDPIPIVRDAAQDLVDRLRVVERSLPDMPTDVAYPQVASAVNACVQRLAALSLRGPANRLPSSELWNVAGSILQRGWLQNQARTKPRGYAGDHEMLARIYENRVCDDPLGSLFDRYFQEEAAPQAVRNRMRMMADWICDEARQSMRTVQVAVVGSAFGLEVRDALIQLTSEVRGRLKIVLLDLDPAAIEAARRSLAPLVVPEQLVATSANLFRLASRPQLAAPLLGTDLLFCPGLLDYWDDALAAEMLRLFWQNLSPTGRMTAFQFAPHNPTRTYMEWLGNWYLLYRDRDAVAALAEAAAIPAANVKLGSEPLGVDLYLTASRC